ncbi:unnamed protein product [Cuscuta epithymum]|uniref:Diacylglycerol O-acyltransferase n=1 Tax=Cuscuta epithymum TaxID=186058 RepID=A0AAV0EUP4_9ASTE|nr:unnamed protein product [Cuscuta epithymum]
MEYVLDGEEGVEPASPSAQYLNSKVLSLSIIAVLETKVAFEIDETELVSTVKDVFLPINRRFSSIMVNEKNGKKKWKSVEVNPIDHLKFPTYPIGKPLVYYDKCLSEYLTNIALDPFPQSRPLWEIHIFRYPTSNAAGNCIFKLHHSLGDGYSLMGALLSCLQRASNSKLPLTFPRRERSKTERDNFIGRVFKAVPRFLSGIVHTALDFSWSVLKSSLVDDDRTAIHSQDDGVEFRPLSLTTMSFSLNLLTQIKSSLNVTINDVMTGIVTYGIRLYMQEIDKETCNGRCTSLVLFNTRATKGYTSVDEMIKPNAEMPWGNRFTFLAFEIPKLVFDSESSDPLGFVFRAHHMVKRQKSSASVYLNGQLLEFLRKFRGPEATSGYLHGMLRNTSITMSNMIGPVEETTVINHPVKDIYFFVAGSPQSLSVTMVSYMGNLRLAIVFEKDFIDADKIKSSIQYAFDEIFKLSVQS